MCLNKGTSQYPTVLLLQHGDFNSFMPELFASQVGMQVLKANGTAELSRKQWSWEAGGMRSRRNSEASGKWDCRMEWMSKGTVGGLRQLRFGLAGYSQGEG